MPEHVKIIKSDICSNSGFMNTNTYDDPAFLYTGTYDETGKQIYNETIIFRDSYIANYKCTYGKTGRAYLSEYFDRDGIIRLINKYTD